VRPLYLRKLSSVIPGRHIVAEKLITYDSLKLTKLRCARNVVPWLEIKDFRFRREPDQEIAFQAQNSRNKSFFQGTSGKSRVEMACQFWGTVWFSCSIPRLSEPKSRTILRLYRSNLTVSQNLNHIDCTFRDLWTDEAPQISRIIAMRLLSFTSTMRSWMPPYLW
jgi:hypothetical protein